MKKNETCHKTLSLVMVVLVALLAYVIVATYKETPKIKDTSRTIYPQIETTDLEETEVETETTEESEEESLEVEATE